MKKEFASLSNDELVSDIKKCVAIERAATLAVLERLREVERRLIHLEIGYSSFHEFCVVELGYSDGAAARRINAMELCEELPKAKAAIADGRLSLSNAASLQSYLAKEPERHSTPESRDALLTEIEGKSRRECERIFYPDQTGARIVFIADEETMSDLKRLSELLAIPASDQATLIKKLAKIALKSIDPLQRKTRTTTKIDSRKLSTPPAELNRSEPSAKSEPNVKPKAVRYVPRAIKKAVWARDDSQCAYINPHTGKRCSSHYGLQFDHILPVALGGLSTMENLRLLCFAHNHFEAQRIFGREKMAQFNPSLRQ